MNTDLLCTIRDICAPDKRLPGLPDRNIELRRPLTLPEQAAYTRVASEQRTITHLPSYNSCIGKYSDMRTQHINPSQNTL